MSTILLVQPKNDYQTVEFSLTLGALGGALKEKGHQVYYLLLDMVWNQSWQPRDIPATTDIVGITVTSYHFNADVALARQIALTAAPPLIVAGGAHATFDPESLLRKGFDICVRGEGEETVCQLAAGYHTAKKTKNWLASIPGISYQKVTGKIIHNEGKTLVKNLDDLPLPDWQQDDYAKLIKQNRLSFWEPTRHFFKNKKMKTFMLESSRGCPYKCIFCTASKIKGKTWRGKSVERILAEFFHFKSFCSAVPGSKKQQYQYLIQFPDDNFCYDYNRVQAFCKQILALPANDRPLWTIMARANRLGETGLIKLMKKAGCLRIFIGAECGYEAGLKRIKKGITLKMIEQAVKNCLATKIPYIVLSWIIGFPWEGRREVLTTILCAMQLALLKPESIKISIFTFTPNAGAEISDQLDYRLLGTASDYERYTSWGFDHPHLNDQDLFELQMTAQWLNYLLNAGHNRPPRETKFKKELTQIRHQISKVRMGMKSEIMQRLFIQVQEFLNRHSQDTPDQFSTSIEGELPCWLQLLKEEVEQSVGLIKP